MSEDEIIKTIKEKTDIIKSLCTDDCINKSTVIEPLEYSIKVLLDLYQQEKEKNKESINIKDIEFSNFINERYISKDRIRELKNFYIQECKDKNIDLIPFENIIDNLKILEE